MLKVETVRTTELGDRSYVAHDGSNAIVIDPQRDIDRVQAILGELGLVCTLVLETHIHNDYVTGGLALAKATGASYGVASDDDVEFERRGVVDGDELAAGSLRVTAISTPGHTEHHLAFVVRGEEAPAVVFSGGSLLYGSVGRTDLVGKAMTAALTHAQYRSVRRLAGLLEDDTPIYPTHGFGSFCSSGATSGVETSTIGIEKRGNEALTTPDEERFVERLVAGLSAYPSYYAHMAPLNRRGPKSPELVAPSTVDPTLLAARIGAGEWVVDLRSRTAFAKEHLGNTISIALDDGFSTYLGWLHPWGAPLTLIGEDPVLILEAQRQLARIGIDRLDGAASGSPNSLAAGRPLRSYRTAAFSELGGEVDARVLDVRRRDERAQALIPGSLHVPLDELVERVDELPNEQLWVHCVSGYRASIAASLLERAGHSVVLIDDDFDNADRLGLVAHNVGV